MTPTLAGLGLLQGLHALKDAGNGLVPLTVLLLGLLVHAPHHHILPAEHIAQPAQDVLTALANNLYSVYTCNPDLAGGSLKEQLETLSREEFVDSQETYFPSAP